jgi:hypothetical protein
LQKFGYDGMRGSVVLFFGGCHRVVTPHCIHPFAITTYRPYTA